MSSFLFVTDLENTLVGDDDALKTLNHQLAKHRERFKTKIVYATGRSLYLYRLLAREKSLLTPDALITSAGTEMYFTEEDSFDLEWAKVLSQGWDREDIMDIASNCPELESQPKSEQNPFKISYYLAQAVAERVLRKLNADLTARGYEIQIFYSAGQDLDLLPKNGDQSLAVEFLRDRWNIGAKKTIVCGDSGNDIALFQREEKGIIVGNAKPALMQWYANNKSESIYCAEASCAGGILEGLKHFSFL